MLNLAGVALKDIKHIYYGAAGANSPTDFDIFKKEFSKAAANIPLAFEKHGWIALHSGTIAQSGMVVTCATANTHFALNAKGQQMRIGGLCDFLGDVLGAHSIARYAMRSAVRAEDGRDFPTILSWKFRP